MWVSVLSQCSTYCVTMGDMTHDQRERRSKDINDTFEEENIIIFNDVDMA